MTYSESGCKGTSAVVADFHFQTCQPHQTFGNLPGDGLAGFYYYLDGTPQATYKMNVECVGKLPPSPPPFPYPGKPKPKPNAYLRTENGNPNTDENTSE